MFQRSASSFLCTMSVISFKCKVGETSYTIELISDSKVLQAKEELEKQVETLQGSGQKWIYQGMVQVTS